VRTIRVKITPLDGSPVWYASTVCTMASVARHIQKLNDFARHRGVNGRYELATEEDYQQYRREIREATRGGDRSPEVADQHVSQPARLAK